MPGSSRANSTRRDREGSRVGFSLVGELGEVGGVGDEPGRAVAQELVRAIARGASDWSRHGTHRTPQPRGFLRDQPCPRPGARLYDHRRPRQPGEDAAAVDEPLPGRNRARRLFAHDQPVVGDTAEQFGVPGRVEAIKPAGHDRDRVPLHAQRGTERRGLDAVGTAGDDDLFLSRRLGDEFRGDVHPVLGGGTRPGDGDARMRRLCEEGGRPDRPQRIRGAVAQLVQRDRPVRIARDQHRV